MSSFSLRDMIAKAALDHYLSSLPRKGKPSESEWTVYAAIVATFRTSNGDDESINVRVMSSATGSKCTSLNGHIKRFSNLDIPGCLRSTDEFHLQTECTCSCFCQEQAKALILRDSHAEILARRGLVRVLWKEILNDCIDRKYDSIRRASSHHLRLLERVHTKQGNTNQTLRYRIRQGVELHMYISDSVSVGMKKIL